MATITFNKVGIRAISACVPKNISDNKTLVNMLPEEEVNKVIENIGIKEKRFADKDVCSSDLCYKAAEQLLNDNNIDRNSIDALIFLSQTPDYHQPATAPSLQYRLGLPKTTLSFDVNLACSGYVYGLSIAFAYASLQGINNVLLLVGETMSKTISPKDKVSFPLFGDAGTATLIQKSEQFGEALFSLNSDGSESKILNMPYGGYRNPSSVEGLKEITDAEGNIRTGEHLCMDGMEVFNFGLREVPKDIKKIMELANLSFDTIDLVLFHQANKFMTDFFAKKLKISIDKVPYSLDKYGNTSSASIPLTISSELKSADLNEKTAVLCGFGAGLSWATALIQFNNCNVSPVIEY
jgi:3-oxoacyl-[acyl-carrier-protein] synthase-3